MNPRFRAETMAAFYNEEYYSGTSEYSYRDERKALEFFRYVWERRIDIMRRYVREGNLLDVGCSFGGFLMAASRFFVPHGIEISPFAGRHARELIGDTIHIGTLEDHPFKHEHFSAITMIELLEHLPDPPAVLRECHGLLQRGGLLVVQTANMDGLQAKILGTNYAYYMPGHLSYFTRKNLFAALKAAGFSRTRAYHPVEFGLLPKLKKSRADMRRPLDYLKWIRIAAYHYAGKIHFRDFAATSSMVVYAIK
jgi:2-polyprenyl-3-methyl-5-hydroxy-6-metoxy-1,4-benzoquinol methylase